nr:tRNA-dihydrouridine synthase [Sneathiella glossodoripedis]
MAEPELVADCVAAMKDATTLPVTVKNRIGIDDLDSYEHLVHFTQTIKDKGCETFIIHARKAWLTGLSPKENRTIPPLKYDVVYQLKKDFPELEIIINGGIQTLEEIDSHLQAVDGVMIGREAIRIHIFWRKLTSAITAFQTMRQSAKKWSKKSCPISIPKWQKEFL